MKKLVYALLLLLTVNTAFAAPRDLAEAKRIALKLKEQSLSTQRRVRSAQPIELSYVSQRTNLNEAYYYVFNRGEKKGFVIVSGDDRMPEVLAYSDRGDFDWETAPENCKAFLATYEKQTDALDNVETKVLKEIEEVVGAEDEMPSSVAPLVDPIAWSQSTPYNDKCPKDPTTESISVAGCVATAMSQVMKYHNWPETSKDTTITYTTDTRRMKVTSDFNNAYDWENILPVYQRIGGHETRTQKKAVALLLADVGVSLHMDYTSRGSGASSSRIPGALHKVFYYDEGARMVYRRYYMWKEWMSLIKTELSQQRPIIFRGSSKGGGHAFVCDGYDENNLVHINWGWGGSSNGYFYPTNLQPHAQGIGAGSAEGYNVGQAMVIGIQKPTDDNDAIRPQMKFNDYVYREGTNDKSEEINIKIDNFGTANSFNFSGEIALDLYNANTGAFVEHLVSKDVNTVNGYIYDISLSFVPVAIPKGEYKIKMRYLEEGAQGYLFARAKWGFIPSISFSVNDDEVTLTRPAEETPSFQVEDWEIEGMKETSVMQGKTYKATFTLTNTSEVDVVTNLAVGMHDEANDRTVFLDFVPLDLAGGAQQEITLPFKVFTSLALGNYKLGLYYYTSGSQFTKLIYVTKSRMELITEQAVEVEDLHETIPFMQGFEEKELSWILNDPSSMLLSGRSIGLEAAEGDNYLVSRPSSTARDAWVYSPKVSLTQGQKLHASTYVWAAGNGFNDEFTLTVGTSQSPEHQEHMIVDKSGEHSASYTTFTEVGGDFIVPSSGDYYFALHICTSKANGYYMLFDKFQVKEQTAQGIEGLDVIKEVAYVSYFTLAGVKVQVPVEKGLYVKRIYYVDGTVKTEKMMVR